MLFRSRVHDPRKRRQIRCALRWRARLTDARTLRRVASQISEVLWTPSGRALFPSLGGSRRVLRLGCCGHPQSRCYSTGKRTKWLWPYMNSLRLVVFLRVRRRSRQHGDRVLKALRQRRPNRNQMTQSGIVWHVGYRFGGRHRLAVVAPCPAQRGKPLDGLGEVVDLQCPFGKRA